MVPRINRKERKKERKPKEFLEIVTKKVLIFAYKKSFFFQFSGRKRGGSETGISYMDEKRVCRLR